MDENNQIDIFRSERVSIAVLKNAIPAMIAMLMTLIYNIADTFFIGRTHNDLQIAAVSICTPIFLLFMSIGMIFGIGGVSVISRAIGEGRKEYVRKVSAFCTWVSVFSGVVIVALFWIFMDQILMLIGITKDVWDYVKSYMMIVTVCGPLLLVSTCFSNIIRAEGQANVAMTGMMLGNLSNIVLDPILILFVGWEIKGAAIATVIGNLISTIYYLLYFGRGTSILSIDFKNFTVKEDICKNVLVIGVPAALAGLLISISHILVNSRMIQYGDLAVAAVGVAGKVTMMTGMVCIGLGQGVQPILGYCVGAKNWERFKKVLVFSLIFALILSSVLTGICYYFATEIINVFLTDTSAFELGVRFARIFMTTSFLFGVYFVLVNTLQAMGAATQSLIVNVSRQGLLFIPLLFILEKEFGMNGLIWTQPIVDVLSLLLAIVLLVPLYHKMSSESLLKVES